MNSHKTHGFRETRDSLAAGLRESVALNNGVHMPWFGLGVFQITSDAQTETIVRSAIDLGYRSVDTASLYGNERGVGRAVRGCGLAREQLFVATKVWNDDLRRDRVEGAFQESLKRLGLEYVDLYLVHWPVGGKFVGAWRTLENLFRSGRVRAIGVSNFMVPHLEELASSWDIVPAVNQIEFHPYLQSEALLTWCGAKNIRVEAWSPLMQAGEILRDPVLTAIARKHGKSVAQVILRWDVQSGVITIPKSADPARIRENADIFDFVLSDDEMAQIAKLDRQQRSGADPFNFHF